MCTVKDGLAAPVMAKWEKPEGLNETHAILGSAGFPHSLQAAKKYWVGWKFNINSREEEVTC